MSGECSPFRSHDVGVKRSKALIVSAGLSGLFLIVYGGCNWITARRANVGTFYFEWEHKIPFLPLFILPYMSIDLFFVGTIANCPSWLNELQQRLSLLEVVFYFFRCGLHFRDPTLLAGSAHCSIGFVKWMRRTISSHRFTPHSR